MLGCAACAKGEDAEAFGGSFTRANCSESESRLPVELFAFFSEHKQKQTLDINLRVMVNVSDERTNAVIV